MRAAGSTLTVSELIDELLTRRGSTTGEILVQYADGDTATVTETEVTAYGLVLHTATDSLQQMVNDLCTKLEAVTELPKKGGREAVMQALDTILSELESWTT